ncbi:MULTISPECIES: Rrf2 family transcriptional regulator [Paenibacillus]|jgi:DNA-binding IscR family transcriptional regulator|uniref:BadM/Rrf2 family transcriptional regulator n=1 Tax=Paenibacillus pabuli TaxID=1472 RepID=A0A855YDV4_9BACL|nr:MULTISPECIES: Rrf2 family transcriptional regulator [Paenibacillus]PWW43197.1 BadM/Rrf2 family transcriptional regulator [Paenibacillus pabuli]PXW09103.1 BadM/Rrf2 family transcriptional regulator [Paenibacillus taichungensis]QLG39203.1 Rrf2 family transcriptional regulator [Paenibacillus sp. E222]RAJ03239.1 BadM/Rrf2 family transcriptional regulator [Paenibacillus pabuli]SEO18599.1 transcriptional regulator, BadM/Rrf2 family [Paenibacillus sp. OK076]
MKQISSRFSIAVHTLSLIAVVPNECTGDFIAKSVNTNPVIIRRIMSKLKQAGLIEVRPGVGGASLLKDPADITLLDIYRALEVVEDGELFNFHKHPNPNCPVGSMIEQTLRAELIEAQLAMEQRLKRVTIQQMMDQVHVSE